MRRFFVVIIIIFFTTSCKEDEKTLQLVKSKSYASLEVLTQVKEDLIPLSSDTDFRNMVYRFLELKQFGEYTILTKQLRAGLKGYRMSHPTKLRYNFDLDSLFDARNEQLYPQIFVPFFEELKEQGKIGRTNPIIIVYNGDESVMEYEGVQISENGDNLSYHRVNENYAKKNEVWIISYNEDLIDGLIMIPDDCNPDLGCTIDTGGDSGGNDNPSDPPDTGPIRKFCWDDGVEDGTTPYPEGINFYLQKIQVNCHKEPWTAGKSEVKMKFTSNTCSGNDLPHWRIYMGIWVVDGVSYLVPEKDEVREFGWDISRSTINDGTEIIKNLNVTQVNIPYYNCPSYYQGRFCEPEYTTNVGWGYNGGNVVDTRGDYIYFIVYEYDHLIGSWKTETFSNCSNEVSLDYYSQNGLYTSGFVNNVKPLGNNRSDYGDYPCKDFENDCISFNFYTKKHMPTQW